MGRTSAKRGNDSQRGSLTTSNNIVTSPHLPVRMGPGKIIVAMSPILSRTTHGAVSSHKQHSGSIEPSTPANRYEQSNQGRTLVFAKGRNNSQ